MRNFGLGGSSSEETGDRSRQPEGGGNQPPLRGNEILAGTVPDDSQGASDSRVSGNELDRPNASSRDSAGLGGDRTKQKETLSDMDERHNSEIRDETMRHGREVATIDQGYGREHLELTREREQSINNYRTRRVQELLEHPNIHRSLALGMIVTASNAMAEQFQQREDELLQRTQAQKRTKLEEHQRNMEEIRKRHRDEKTAIEDTTVNETPKSE